MPKPARSQNDKAQEKNRILTSACDIICEEGFERFSMRKLATRVGMTATNLYNYFSGKDEIYLAIQTRGFEELQALFTQAATSYSEPLDLLEAFIDAYLDFGLHQKDYYDIMFSWNTPKFADYVGTPLEPLARTEKETGLKVALITEDVIREAAPSLTDADVHFYAMKTWTGLHGIINLLNSRVLQEVIEDQEGFLARLKAELLSPFRF